MKIFNYFLLCIFLCSCSIVLGKQGFETLTNRVKSALIAGNAKDLVRNFSNTVSLTVKKQDGIYSRFQAELIIDEFFRNNRSLEVKEVQKVVTTPLSFFIVYSLKTNNAHYRVFVKFSEIDKEARIVEFRLE